MWIAKQQTLDWGNNTAATVRRSLLKCKVPSTILGTTIHATLFLKDSPTPRERKNRLQLLVACTIDPTMRCAGAPRAYAARGTSPSNGTNYTVILCFRVLKPSRRAQSIDLRPRGSSQRRSTVALLRANASGYRVGLARASDVGNDVLRTWKTLMGANVTI